jgi:hypothetical protein
MIRVTNMKQFQKDLDRFAKKIDANPDIVAQKVSLEILKGVIEKTPVRTGWCRANWNFSRGYPDTRVLPKKRPSESVAAPIAVAKYHEGLLKGDRPVYYVTNNVPYAVYLEAGHSKQMGKGMMIQRTISEVQNQVRQLLKEIA